MIKIFAAGLLSALVLAVLPRNGVLSATQEILGLFSLMMAGLLPTMLLTATVMRASKLSAKAVAEYGVALRSQMHFWAVLFLSCLVGAIAVTTAKIFGSAYPGGSNNGSLVVTLSVAITGFCLGVIFFRISSAYQGVLSLLGLNVGLAKEEAAAADADRARDFVAKVTSEAARFKAPG